jgi:hypothetical protein
MRLKGLPYGPYTAVSSTSLSVAKRGRQSALSAAQLGYACVSGISSAWLLIGTLREGRHHTAANGDLSSAWQPLVRRNKEAVLVQHVRLPDAQIARTR